MQKLVWRDISFATYLACSKKELQAGICTLCLLASLEQFKSRAAVIWVSIILDEGAAIFKLVTVKKEQVLCLGQQLCSCYRITREQNVVAFLSLGCLQKGRTPSVSVCWARHRHCLASTSQAGSACTEYVGETKPLKLSVQRTVLVTLQLELNVICCVGINPRSPLQASLCKHSTILWHRVVDSHSDSSCCSCQPSLQIGSTALLQES